MEFVQELKQNTINKINELNQLLTILEEKTDKQALMTIRRQLITKRFLNKKHQGNHNNLRVKAFNLQLKSDVNKLLKEFDEIFNIGEDDYTSYDRKTIY